MPQMPNAKPNNGSERKHGRPLGKRSQFDELLIEVFGGKYQWRRRAYLKDYLIRAHKHSPEEADNIITRNVNAGLEGGTFYYVTLRAELLAWREKLLAERASKAGKAKAKKWPKWSQERRHRFMDKKYRGGS
jgi:hypothetical protein